MHCSVLNAERIVPERGKVLLVFVNNLESIYRLHFFLLAAENRFPGIKGLLDIFISCDIPKDSFFLTAYTGSLSSRQLC